VQDKETGSGREEKPYLSQETQLWVRAAAGQVPASWGVVEEFACAQVCQLVYGVS
jgi:hypothetical protein